QLAAGAIELQRVRAIGTLQRAAMGELGEHRQRNAIGFRDGAAAFQHGQAVTAARERFGVGEFGHEVFSRTSVRKPLSARSCSIATTSVAMVSRGAAYFAARWSMMSAVLRSPSQSLRTSTAISSGASTR